MSKKHDKDPLGQRMKRYEESYKIKMPLRMPVLLRIDGKTFHTVTKKMGFKKPFDENIHSSMIDIMQQLMHKVSGFKLAYTQSDEISILLVNYDKLETQAYFDNELQKLVSIIASIAGAVFNRPQTWRFSAGDDYPVFDCRAWVMPPDDVENYFLWRYKDARRNAINSLGQANFSHGLLQGKNQQEVIEMLDQKGIYFENQPKEFQNGTCLYIAKQNEDKTQPQTVSLTSDIDFGSEHWRNIIRKFVYPERNIILE
jgi:tRNA(His) 5'-end guanylyltransferase